MVDAYAAQHPGVPSPQSIQSVAVHLLTLYGVLARGLAPAQALWLRRRVLRGTPQARHSRFAWLDPPSFAGRSTVAAIAQADAPVARTALAISWIKSIWSAWAAGHASTIANWYASYALPERLE